QGDRAPLGQRHQRRVPIQQPGPDLDRIAAVAEFDGELVHQASREGRSGIAGVVAREGSGGILRSALAAHSGRTSQAIIDSTAWSAGCRPVPTTWSATSM